jgi:hypothetical protein
MESGSGPGTLRTGVLISVLKMDLLLGMLRAKIEKVAKTMPKRGIFLVENRNFAQKLNFFFAQKSNF